MLCACSCDELDSLRVSITSADGERSEISVYCADKRPPAMLMSGASGRLYVTLTSRSPPPSEATATRSGFTADFSFVTGTYNTNSLLLYY